MRKTILLTGALVAAATGRTLAQSPATDPTYNEDAPFVRNIRPDRPGQTVTTSMLRPGQFQVELGTQRQLPATGSARTLSSGLLRVGFFNHMELRLTQGYLHAGPPLLGADVSRPAFGLAPLTVGAKWLASTHQDARSQVVFLTELTLPKTGDQTMHLAKPLASARALVSQQIGQRFGVETNLGFSQSGFRAADTKQGQFLYTLALNGPLTGKFGFFTEAYGFGRQSFTHGGTLGLNWRPLPGLRLDVSAGRSVTGQRGTVLSGGLSVRLPH
ncbi:transporter [Hymenobacter sp. 15J16-1T3B]|uniref:transporter n=1 Tax=Hymenobacter sp. 15J16-1T3B TaxID=2886941 RepID=UPI001D100C2E|nr:transporter [Hymenobacter sp. 15J16-1T3B]MCC3159329.1 transporter [Hymenobacter sp. 15J16-1T3B]